MLATHIPPLVDDVERLKALASYAILDTPAEDGFDDIVQLATHVCDAPVALVSFVAEGRQWFKARIGFPACETDLNSSVCAHALAEPDLLVIPDLARDPRTRDNPLVAGDPFIRFYAGAPLRTAAGEALGSLCVIDRQPRPDGLTKAQAESLRALGRQVMSQLELRRALLNRDDLLVAQRDAIRGRDVLRETQAAVANAGGDIDVILDAVLAGAMRALPTADAGVVELIDGEELEYRAVRGILAPHRGLRVPRHGSLAGWCAWNDEPLLIADALADRRTVPERIGRLGLRSAVLAPVARAGRVVGVLKLQSARVDAFMPEDLEIARMFAGAVTAGLTEASAAASSRAVSESESRYRSIFESATDIAIVATDRDGRITNWNVGATRILGWSSDEIRGEPLGCFFTPEDNATGQVALEMANALAHGRASDERWHIRKDGSRFFASGEVMPLRGPANEHLGFIKMLRDRTAEHEAGTALREAEALLRRAQEVGGVGVFSVDLADNMLHATPEFCRLYGVPERESFPADLIEGLVHPDDVALRSDAAARERGDIVGDVTYRIRRADDGRERWIERKADIERDDMGRPRRFVGTARDITDQIAAQRDLAAEREQLAQLFEQAPTFMALLRGPDHRFERVNPGYSQLIGHREVVGRTVAEALPDAVEQGFLDILDEVYRTGEPFNATAMKYVAQPVPGGPVDVRYLDFVYQPLRDANGKVYGLFTEGVDVTARTLANAELRAGERRRAVLLELADAIRDMRDPAAIAHVSSEMLGEALAVSRVGYGTVDTANETIVIEREWDEPGVRCLEGTLRFRDYGSYIEDLKRGATVAISDVDSDPRTRAGAAALKAISASAFVNMPLVEHGEFVALIYVNHIEPRVWSEHDLRFIREIGERVRVATERLKSEQALRDSEEHFRVFAQAVPNHVWASRPDGYLDWFNEQVYTYGGVESGSVDGAEKWAEMVHPDDRPEAGEAWTRALETGTVYETEFRVLRHDGAYRWFLVRAEPVRNAAGEITCWVGTNTDIDDRRQQAAELERLNLGLEDEIEKRTRERDRVWSSTNDLMATAGLDGYLKTVNPAWTRVLGWSEGELLARPFFELIDAADHAETLNVVRRLAEQQPITGFVDRVIQKDGAQRTIMWEAAPSGDVFHIVGRDITALRRAEEQLRQSQKMEAVGQLTGGLAHDFNNLLTGITGSLDLMTTRMAQGRFADIERYTSAAQGAAKRAAALTHRLLAFSRQQTLDPKPTDVNRLVAGMEDLVRRTVGPAVEVETVAAGGLWPTLVDPNQLENALLNLCINARDAMPSGGRLTIETCNRWLDQRAARERELPPGQYVSLCVSDSGTGMTPEVIAKAFDPFFTTKPIGQGTGLGLSMIYGFARQSGGQVRIYSEVGDGAMVCIYLPRHLGDAEEADTPAELDTTLRAGAGETVLVVDDEPTVRMLVTEILEELGYAAIEAADGTAGLKVLQSDQRIDLLVTDVGLPGGMNGRQMADAARVDRPNLQVLFITGYAENAVVGNGHLDPGMHVMTKPFAMDVLASRIRELIAKS